MTNHVYALGRLLVFAYGCNWIVNGSGLPSRAPVNVSKLQSPRESVSGVHIASFDTTTRHVGSGVLSVSCNMVYREHALTFLVHAVTNDCLSVGSSEEKDVKEDAINMFDLVISDRGGDGIGCISNRPIMFVARYL